MNFLFSDILGMNLPFKICRINQDVVYSGAREDGIWYLYISTCESQNWTLLNEKQQIAALLKDPNARVFNTEYNE